MTENMKITIEVPDNTAAVSVTYIYGDGNVQRMSTHLLDTEDIKSQRESEEE